MTTAITYQSGPRKSDLRTVVVDDVRTSTVLLPTGRMDVVVAKLLHGTACRHKFWDEILGTSGDDFVVEASQVVFERDMQVAVKVRRHK
jgi:hypothetical protein